MLASLRCPTPLRLAVVLLLGIPFTLMAEPIHISGRAQGAGQERIEASVEPATTGAILTAASSADGSFRFTAVGDGTFRLSGNAPGFAEGYAPGEIQVAGQAVRGLELRLSRGATLTGKVLGSTRRRWGTSSSSRPRTGIERPEKR
jgi:hypothetical protein